MAFSDLVGGRENIIGGPFGSNLTQADYTSSGVPIIRGSNMERFGRFTGGDFAYVSIEKAVRLASSQVVAGDIVVTQRGTMGQVSIVSASAAPRYIVSQSQMGVHVKGADPLFVYYLLRSPSFTRFLDRSTIQTGVPHINMGLLRDWQVNAPHVDEQVRIGRVLGAFDDRIELNLKTNMTLEAMARALFKSWFVDFDPVRANAEGRDPGLCPEIAGLFPDSFETSEVGEIPKGWQVRGLDGIAKFLNGLALQNYPPVNGSSLPVIKIAQLRSGHTTSADLASADVDPQYIVGDGDVLFSWSGSLECVLWTGGAGALNQHLFKVSSSFPKWFYYLWIHQHLENFRHIAAGKATTMGHIQRHHLSDAKVVVPTSKILKRAGSILSLLIDRVIMTRLQSRTLGHIRDALLPKLISGEVRVRDNVDQPTDAGGVERDSDAARHTSPLSKMKSRRTRR